MTEINYSSLLRQVADDYFEHRLTRVEYLAQRRDILDRIDREFNGEDGTSGSSESDINGDVTQPADSDSSLAAVITRRTESGGRNTHE